MCRCKTLFVFAVYNSEIGIPRIQYIILIQNSSYNMFFAMFQLCSNVLVRFVDLLFPLSLDFFPPIVALFVCKSTYTLVSFSFSLANALKIRRSFHRNATWVVDTQRLCNVCCVYNVHANCENKGDLIYGTHMLVHFKFVFVVFFLFFVCRFFIHFSSNKCVTHSLWPLIQFSFHITQL